MESLPHPDCDCWRLTAPLEGSDPLPDHLCVETLRGSVAAAMRDGVLPSSRWWPTAIDDGAPVHGVLRQWAEEAPSQALATALAREFGWCQLVLGIRAGADRRLATDAGLAAQLGTFGLPTTPSTLRHLRGVAAEAPAPPLPARGVLVTTLLRTPPPHTVTVAGALDTMTTALLAVVAGIVARHRAFAATVVGLARATDLRRGALATGRRERQDVDYAAVAWAERQVLPALVAGHPNGLEGALTEYCEVIAHRVRERRRRAGLATTPPPGWRDDVRAALREWVHAAS